MKPAYLLLVWAFAFCLLACGSCRSWRNKLDANPAPATVAPAEDTPAVDQYADTITTWAIRFTVVGLLLSVGGLVAAWGLHLGAGKDIALVGVIILLASGALATFADYAKVIAVVAGVMFALYYIWLLWRRYQDEKVQAELVESAEYLKTQTDWTEYAKDHLRRVQSPATRKVVDKVQGKK